jgi:hypothetical protein
MTRQAHTDFSFAPSEIAEGFRQQGNDLFKARKFRDAIGFYTRALDEVGKDLDIEERRTLWGNRAAANLELSAFPFPLSFFRCEEWRSADGACARAQRTTERHFGIVPSSSPPETQTSPTPPLRRPTKRP